LACILLQVHRLHRLIAKVHWIKLTSILKNHACVLLVLFCALHPLASGLYPKMDSSYNTIYVGRATSLLMRLQTYSMELVSWTSSFDRP